MKVLILMGSPRIHGNTAELCKPLREELERGGAEVLYMPIADKHILPCKACYACQNVQDVYGCAQKDDMEQVSKDCASTLISSTSECIPYGIRTIWHPFKQKKQWQEQGSLRRRF